MKITRKCPNCFQENSSDDLFCIFCGYDFRGTAPAGIPESGVTSVPDEPAAAAAYDGPRYCPRGHDVPDPSLGFCPICGSPLTDRPADESASAETLPAPEEPDVPDTVPDPEPYGAAEPRKCSCGYVCDDPGLDFCPACGMPFDTGRHPEETDPGWTCSCGAVNEPGTDFCTRCGKRKDRGEAPAIPGGMRPPTDRDLEIKATYDPE